MMGTSARAAWVYGRAYGCTIERKGYVTALFVEHLHKLFSGFCVLVAQAAWLADYCILEGAGSVVPPVRWLAGASLVQGIDV